MNFSNACQGFQLEACFFTESMTADVLNLQSFLGTFSKETSLAREAQLYAKNH